MTIASAITAAQGRVADAYTAISNKGGTLPATQNLANMPTAINSISTGGTIDSLTITPSISQQTITASGGTDGYSPITVDAVTSAIDANITAGNIKSGVSILGVSGDVVELNGETRTVSLTGFGQTFTPSSGKNAITSITVNPANLARTVNPSTTTQSIGVQSGFSGNGTITVNPVTASIDANIQVGNIKSGVTILGVTGTYGGGSSKYGATTDTFLGDIDANGILKRPSGAADLVFTGVKDIDYYGLYYKFEYTNITTLSFPDLISISNPYGCYYMCANSAVTSASMPKLTTISAVNACSRMFYYCLNLTSVYLPELTSVTGQAAIEYLIAYCPNVTSISLPKLSVLTGSNAMRDFCYGNTGIEHIYFNSLTTTSFGSYRNQFTSMMQGTGTNVTHTLHFPSNLTTTIGGLSGYPLFGGTSGYVVCAFDLPATS